MFKKILGGVLFAHAFTAGISCFFIFGITINNPIFWIYIIPMCFGLAWIGSSLWNSN